MRRLLWAIVLFGAYVWLLTSGNDQLVLKQGKALYQAVVTWLEGADIDYNLKNNRSSKKSRRWD